MNKILFIIISISISFADIYISGDARVRPRLDIKDNPEDNVKKQSDLYYLYRARLNIKADIGEGYFFRAKLGTNEVSAISKMAYDGDHTSVPGHLNSSRPQVDFLQLYFGYKKENSGFLGGAFPLKSNPALDIHFYPNKIVDIPFSSLNNGALTGFAGYRKISNYNFDWFLSVDNQKINSSTDVNDVTTKFSDSYTLGLKTKINVGSLGFQPQLLSTFGDSTENKPLTFGSSLNLMDLAGFQSSFSYFISKNSENTAYDAQHLRLSLKRNFNSGSLKLFYDIASYEETEIMDLTYLWISYSYLVHNNELGSIIIKPTVRVQNGSTSNSNYARTKFELTTEIKFK